MLNTHKSYPFWRSRLCDVDAALDAAVRGEVHTLCRSAGGRTIRYITYGEKEDYGRRANYISACGGRDKNCYADRRGKRPTLMLIGATHGQETEGVAAILNLISVLETGADLRGRAVPAMLEPFLRHNPRLILIPVYNVDGRARCVPDSMIGEPPLSLRYHGQGTWKDGGYCGWPECKKVHPIREHADHLGSYFNDDGVNLMLDNFFVPMAEETKALLRLCDEEAPECTLVLHGGSNITNVLIQPEYVPVYIKEGIHRLALDTAKRESALGLPGNVRRVAEAANYPPPAFYLPDAIHHITGGYVSYYESNEGLLDRNAFTPEEILLHHYCLFASMLDLRFRPDGQVL